MTCAAERCESLADFAASVLSSVRRSAAVQCSKPAGAGACDRTARNGTATTANKTIFFIAIHLSFARKFSLAPRIVIHPGSSRNRKSRRSVRAPRFGVVRFFWGVNSEKQFHGQSAPLSDRPPALLG